MFSVFSEELKRILNNARKEMIELKHSYIGTEHFVLAVLKNDCSLKELLLKYNLDYDKFKKKVISFMGIGESDNSLVIFTPLFKKILEDSVMVASDSKKDEVTLALLFSLMLNEGEGVAYRIFCESGIDVDELEDSLDELDYSRLDKSNILSYGVNLNEKILNGEMDPVIGRDKEVSKLIEIIMRKNKCNPILIGDAGVGKTAIVEEFTRRIVNKEVPSRLRNKVVYSVSMADLVSGTKYRGEFEEKILKIIKELEKNKNIILFIDEIHTLVGAGGADGAIDASNIFKPVLARGNITVIGATTTEEYKKYIEDDKALSRRFQKIMVEEPTKEQLLEILFKVKPTYEKFHNVTFDNNLIYYLVNITNKYILNRKEPDRSLDILDEVCSYTTSRNDDIEEKNSKLRKELNEIIEAKNKCLKENNYEKAIEFRKKEREIESLINKNDLKMTTKNTCKRVRKEYIDKVISDKCGVLIDSETTLNSHFRKLRNYLNKNVINQEKVIDKVISSCTCLFSGDKKKESPVSFIFTGTTGVGKTYLANLIGKTLFNNHIVKVDLSNFRDEQSISRIVGAPPGYVGYNNKNNVFESLKEYPSSLILLENYEMAHPKVKDLINQIINTGYFEDSNGYKIEFNNCLIIITSALKDKTLGFNNNTKKEEQENQNLYFNKLNYSDIYKIIKNKLKDRNKSISEEDIKNLIDNSEYQEKGAKKIDALINEFYNSLVI